jgi:hypothetical protein
MNIDLTPKLKAQMGPKPRTRGRYHSSEIYGIMNGWTTPEQWMKASEKTVKEIIMMWNGIGLHNQLEELMGKEHSEQKKEYQYKSITLVAKADFLPPGEKAHQVWEFKTSDKTMEKMKPWHEYQVKLYTTVFERQQGLIYQPVIGENGLYLKHLGTVERDDKWFTDQLDKLLEFHIKVEKLWENQK